MYKAITKTSQDSGVKVVAVEFVGYEDVYNMEVENTHALAVNGGLIVHNCGDATTYRVMNRNKVVKAGPVSLEKQSTWRSTL